MRITADKIDARVALNGDMEVILRVEPDSRNTVRSVIQSLVGHRLAVEIKQWRDKRSKDANAYFWVLCGKIADVLQKSKEEVYIDLLCDYGVFTHIIVKPNVADRVRAEWRTVKELGEVTVNGHTGIQLQCYFGSSTYDTKEMSRLIDGAVHEAKELGIETLPPADLERIKHEWGLTYEAKKQEGQGV